MHSDKKILNAYKAVKKGGFNQRLLDQLEDFNDAVINQFGGNATPTSVLTEWLDRFHSNPTLPKTFRIPELVAMFRFDYDQSRKYLRDLHVLMQNARGYENIQSLGQYLKVYDLKIRNHMRFLSVAMKFATDIPKTPPAKNKELAKRLKVELSQLGDWATKTGSRTLRDIRRRYR